MSFPHRRIASASCLSVVLACAPPDPAPSDEVDSNITSGGVYTLQAVHSGLCVDVTGSSTSSGANIEQWDCSGRSNQQFRFRDTGGGVYEIAPQNSPNTQCVDVFGGSLLSGGNIDQWSCNGHTSQRFRLAQPTAGKFEIIAVNSGKCLDVTGASTARGANIEQWTCSGHTNQLFTLAPVTSSGTGGSAGTGGATPTGGSTGTGGSPGTGDGDGCTLRWSPSASRDGKAAFEGLEMPDSNGVHPGAVHFSTVTDHDAFRIDQHYDPPGAVDYDVKVQDRLRCEVKGMHASGVNLQLVSGQTWRLSWSLLVPSSLQGSTRFHHIWQMKYVDTAGASSDGPVLTLDLINQSGVEKIRLDVFGVTSTAPVKLIHDRWLTTEVTVKIAPGTAGSARWRLWDGATQLADETKAGISTWPSNAARLRPKWGIYRSLGDLSAIQTSYILLSGMKGFTCP
jgi:hypothetical protein